MLKENSRMTKKLQDRHQLELNAGTAFGEEAIKTDLTEANRSSLIKF